MEPQFTDQFRKTIMNAKQMAAKSVYVRPGHLLLAMLEKDPNNGRALSVLESCDVDCELLKATLTEELELSHYAGKLENADRLGGEATAMSMAVSKIITASIDEAKSLADTDVREEHLLLAMLRLRFDDVIGDFPNLTYKSILAKTKELLGVPEEPALLTTEESLLISDEVMKRVEHGKDNMIQLELWIQGLQRSIVRHNTILKDIQGVLSLNEPAKIQINKINKIMESAIGV